MFDYKLSTIRPYGRKRVN